LVDSRAKAPSTKHLTLLDEVEPVSYTDSESFEQEVRDFNRENTEKAVRF
jgi:hypothetical protein